MKNGGVGHHQDYLLIVSPSTLTVWRKHLVAIEYVYCLGVNIPKLAIIALFRKLFPFPMKMIRLAIYSLMGILVALTISTIVTASVACIPFAANWDTTLIDVRCIDREAFFLWSSLPNIITDLDAANQDSVAVNGDGTREDWLNHNLHYRQSVSLFPTISNSLSYLTLMGTAVLLPQSFALLPFPTSLPLQTAHGTP